MLPKEVKDADFRNSAEFRFLHREAEYAQVDITLLCTVYFYVYPRLDCTS